MLHDDKDPLPSVTGSVNDALRLGCSAVGFTIYPGSAHCNAMYEQLQVIAEEAKASGLAVVVWSYPRGSALSKEGETAMDVVAYAAQIAAQLGAHIIKVLLTAHLEQAAAKKVYESTQIPIKTLAERVKHVVQSSFDGRRIVIFSGGAKSEDKNVFEEARGIRDGGGRQHYRTEFLPEAEGGGHQVSPDDHGDLQRRDSVSAPTAMDKSECIL